MLASKWLYVSLETDSRPQWTSEDKKIDLRYYNDRARANEKVARWAAPIVFQNSGRVLKCEWTQDEAKNEGLIKDSRCVYVHELTSMSPRYRAVIDAHQMRGEIKGSRVLKV